MKKGLLIILSGPSGVGKGTVRKILVNNYNLDFVYSISMTTRAPRANEVDGVDYYFVSKETFEQNIKNDNFLEHAEFVDHCYGTPKDKVEALRNEGKNVFLEIEINGATQVMEKCKDDPGLVSIFLMPPSLADLEARIRHRNSESEELIQKRLEKGKREIGMSDKYQYVVINDYVKKASRKIAKIINNRINKQNEDEGK